MKCEQSETWHNIFDCCNPTCLIASVIKSWAIFYDIDLTDTSFYTPEEWKSRGEPWGDNSVLSITFEGELYNVINEGSYKEVNVLIDRLKEIGYFGEQGFAWSMHFYPL